MIPKGERDGTGEETDGTLVAEVADMLCETRVGQVSKILHRCGRARVFVRVIRIWIIQHACGFSRANP